MLPFWVLLLRSARCFSESSHLWRLRAFKDRMITIPEAADGLKEIARSRLTWLNGLMINGDFISGAKICLADVLLFCFLKFGQSVGQPYDSDLDQLHPWFERMAARDSANA